MKTVQDYIAMLGLPAEDKVTGFSGVITSVGFDLYGCVQVILTPSVKKDGSLDDSRWFDIERLDIKSKKPVMKQPNFEFDSVHGPQEKPLM